MILNNYLKQSTKNDKTLIQWTSKAIEAFNICKSKLAEVAMLTHPRVGAKLALTTDALDNMIGALLEQKETDDN